MASPFGLKKPPFYGWFIPLSSLHGFEGQVQSADGMTPSTVRSPTPGDPETTGMKTMDSVVVVVVVVVVSFCESIPFPHSLIPVHDGFPGYRPTSLPKE